MQTIGQVLHFLRLQKKLTLALISKETNISPDLLKALEEDNYQALPSSTFTKGFICSYAKVLNFSCQKALAIFRRDFTVTESGKILPKGLAKPLDKKTFVTSKFAFSFMIFLLLSTFFIYLYVQIKNYNSSPQIDIIRPKVNTVVKGPQITVRGYVSADSSVYVNGNLVDVFPTGEFYASTQLPAGDQVITIKAINSQNKSSESKIPVIVIDN